MKLFNITKLTARIAMIAKSYNWDKMGPSVLMSRKLPGKPTVETISVGVADLKKALEELQRFTDENLFSVKHDKIEIDKYTSLTFRLPVSGGMDAFRVSVSFNNHHHSRSIILLESYTLDIEKFKVNLTSVIDKLELLLTAPISEDGSADLSHIPDTELVMETLPPFHDWEVIPTYIHFDELYKLETVCIEHRNREGIYRYAAFSTTKRSEQLFFLEHEVNTCVDFILSQLDVIGEKSVKSLALSETETLFVTRGGGQAEQNPINIVVVRPSTTEVLNWRDSEKHLNVLKNALNKMKI